MLGKSEFHDSDRDTNSYGVFEHYAGENQVNTGGEGINGCRHTPGTSPRLNFSDKTADKKENRGTGIGKIGRTGIGWLRFSMQILAVVTGRYRFNWFSLRSLGEGQRGRGPIVELICPIQTELVQVNPVEWPQMNIDRFVC